MNPSRVPSALILAAGLVLAAPAHAAMDSFLKIDGVPGESRDPAHMDWIEVDSYQFDAVRQAASGAGAGKASFQDLTITKKQDKSSPKLFQAAATGKHFPAVVLHVRKTAPDKTGQPYLVVTMHDVFISAARPSAGGGHGGPVPTETVTLNFGKVEYQYAPQTGTEPNNRLAAVPGVTSVVAPSGRTMPTPTYGVVSPAAAALSAAGGAAISQPAPAPKITGASAAAPYLGLAVTVTITSTGPCQSAFVDYGDGSIAEGHALTGTSTTLPPHTYPSAGPKTIKVGGRDAPYWPAQKKAPPSHSNDCTGWAPEVNVTLKSAAVAAPAVRK